MKIVGVMDEDPYHWQTWSGSSRYFFEALQRHGVLHAAVSAEIPGRLRRLYQLASVQPSVASWRFRFNLNTRYYAAMTRAAARRIAEVGGEFDAVLQVGAWYDMPSVIDKPVCSYHDGNLAVLLRSPYGHPPIAQRHIQKALDYEKALYQRMRFVFPMSRWLADSFIRDNGVPHDRVFAVGAGVNLPKLRDTTDRSYDAPHILFVGKDFERKGGRYLLRAFELVRREIPDAELTVIGPTLTDAPRGVRCIGSLSKSDPQQVEMLLDEYARASVFVMPSLYEPFGIVFAEAMAHRLPCIGTNICAMPELISDGESGYLVPPRDAQALAQRLLDLLKEPAACKSFGEVGFRKYSANYTWDVVARRICEVMQAGSASTIAA